MGLKFYLTYHAGDVARYGALDQAGRGMKHVDRVRLGPPDQIRSTCVKSKRYNGHDLISEEVSGASDEDPTNAITRVLKRKNEEHPDHPFFIRRS